MIHLFFVVVLLLIYLFFLDGNHGIPLWAVTVQNEPEFPAPWEACSYTPRTMAEFVANHLGPQLEKDHPSVKILMFDHNKDHIIAFAKVLLNDTSIITPSTTTTTTVSSSKYIQGTAYHWYAGGMDRLLDGAVGQPNLHRFHSTLSDLMQVKAKDGDGGGGGNEVASSSSSSNQRRRDSHILLNSEACHCPYTGYAGGDIMIYWARAERYAHTILADLAAGSNGWVGKLYMYIYLFPLFSLSSIDKRTNQLPPPPPPPYLNKRMEFGS